MALRNPLVIVNGQIQQLQAGDTLNGGASAYVSRSETNAESATALAIGMPVYSSAAGSVKRAQANTSATARAVGLCLDVAIAASAAGNILTFGTLTATTAQWDAVVTGETGGLTFGAVYYLDPVNVGKITVTPPSTVGQYVQEIGVALSATDLDVNIKSPILL